MTPHDHYKAAEQFLEQAEDYYAGYDAQVMNLRKAQIHATLASVVSWPPDERAPVEPLDLRKPEFD